MSAPRMLASDLRASGWRCIAWIRDNSEALLAGHLLGAQLQHAAEEVTSVSLRLTSTPASISRSIMLAQVFASVWVLNVRGCWGHPLCLIWPCHWYGAFLLNVAMVNRTAPEVVPSTLQEPLWSPQNPR